MNYSARFLFLRSLLLFAGLLIARAWGFGFLGGALLAAIGIFLTLKPFRPMGYPAAYSILIVISAVILSRIDLDLLAILYGAAASIIFGIFERVRFERFLHNFFPVQLLAFGYAAVYMLACGAIFFAFPGSFNFLAEGVMAILTCILAYECIAWGGVSEGLKADQRKHLLLVSGVCALFCAQLAWALALLPIGYINSAGILGAVFFFGTDLFLLSSQNALDRKTLLIYGGTFVCVVVAILGFSQWTI